MGEVAKRLGVCRSTVYQLCERGELGHVRVSNAIGFLRMRSPTTLLGEPEPRVRKPGFAEIFDRARREAAGPRKAPG